MNQVLIGRIELFAKELWKNNYDELPDGIYDNIDTYTLNKNIDETLFAFKPDITNLGETNLNTSYNTGGLVDNNNNPLEAEIVTPSMNLFSIWNDTYEKYQAINLQSAAATIEGLFETEWYIPTNNFIFTFPLIVSSTHPRQIYNCYIDWGDGSPKSYVDDNTNISQYTHTYSQLGTYRIKIEGEINVLGYNPSTSSMRQYLRKIISFGSNEFVSMHYAFKECSGLTFIEDNAVILTNQTGYEVSFTGLFAACGFASIPSKIFMKAISVTSFQGCFADCVNLTSIPSDLFMYNTLVTSFSSCFYNCVNLTSIPSELFKYNTLTTNFSYCFGFCNFLNIPQDLFRYNILATGFISCFANCVKVTSIPSDLFRYNILITDFATVFTYCIKITSIPDDLFRYNILATDFSLTFYGCRAIQYIPDDLFRYNTLVTNFSSCFSDCKSLLAIPATLFQYNINAIYFSGCFEYCSYHILSIPEDLFRYNVLATSFNSCFYGTLLAPLPENLFKYNILATTFAYCFIYYRQTSIPSNLFKYNTLVTDFRRCFYASELRTVPEYLFRYNTLATNFGSCFLSCDALTLNSNIFCDEATESGTRFSNQVIGISRMFERYSVNFYYTIGTAPTIWEYNSNGFISTGTFYNHSTASLTNYNSIPITWK